MTAPYNPQVERFGCPFCGASSNEPCVEQTNMRDRVVPHAERFTFAAKHTRTYTDQP